MSQQTRPKLYRSIVMICLNSEKVVDFVPNPIADQWIGYYPNEEEAYKAVKQKVAEAEIKRKALDSRYQTIWSVGKVSKQEQEILLNWKTRNMVKMEP